MLMFTLLIKHLIDIVIKTTLEAAKFIGTLTFALGDNGSIRSYSLVVAQSQG
jgi:hypothetical protein